MCVAQGCDTSNLSYSWWDFLKLYLCIVTRRRLICNKINVCSWTMHICIYMNLVPCFVRNISRSISKSYEFLICIDILICYTFTGKYILCAPLPLVPFCSSLRSWLFHLMWTIATKERRTSGWLSSKKRTRTWWINEKVKWKGTEQCSKPCMVGCFVLRIILPSYIGIVINYDIRIPINQPGFHGMSQGFWSLLNWVASICFRQFSVWGSLVVYPPEVWNMGSLNAIITHRIHMIHMYDICTYIFLMVNVGKHASPMDPLGCLEGSNLLKSTASVSISGRNWGSQATIHGL